jgi:hypothetical protein
MQRGRWHGGELLCQSCSDADTDAMQAQGVVVKSVLAITCDCGRELDCPSFTNTCDCGADYNWAGQRLAPRSQWGEETGEPWWECY